MQPFSYRIVLANEGPDDARDVVVTDLLPAELQLASGQVPNPDAGSYDLSSGEWAVPEIVAGAQVTLDIPVEATNPDTADCVLNTATITRAPGDVNLDNNTAIVLVGVRNLAGEPSCVDLHVEIVDWREFNYFDGADPEAGTGIRCRIRKFWAARNPGRENGRNFRTGI